jgi:hypothetical protein
MIPAVVSGSYVYLNLFYSYYPNGPLQTFGQSVLYTVNGASQSSVNIILLPALAIPYQFGFWIQGISARLTQ